MTRKLVSSSPEEVRRELVRVLGSFEDLLETGELRTKVLSLVTAFHLLRDLGSLLLPEESPSSARNRILAYFRKYPLTILHGDELMVISGIQDWPRRVRELRVECGWAIASGITINEMRTEDVVDTLGISMETLRPTEYVLLDENQDRDAAHRWKIANDTRKTKSGGKARILEFLKANVGHAVTGEELRYVAGGSSEWARRVRELRTEEGWPVLTRTSGRPDLPVGVYLLEENRQSPPHDRRIPDPVRRSVLVRDRYTCTVCGWTHGTSTRSDPRHLELHHRDTHAMGGENTEQNLITVCTVCHDDIHRTEHDR